MCVWVKSQERPDCGRVEAWVRTPDSRPPRARARVCVCASLLCSKETRVSRVRVPPGSETWKKQNNKTSVRQPRAHPPATTGVPWSATICWRLSRIEALASSARPHIMKGRPHQVGPLRSIRSLNAVRELPFERLARDQRNTQRAVLGGAMEWSPLRQASVCVQFGVGRDLRHSVGVRANALPPRLPAHQCCRADSQVVDNRVCSPRGLCIDAPTRIQYPARPRTGSNPVTSTLH